MLLKNPKEKGAINERKAKKILEEQGFYVTKSGASLGIFDLVAFLPLTPKIKLVQVKTNFNASPKERNEIKNFKVEKHISKEIWIFIDYKKVPKIKIIP